MATIKQSLNHSAAEAKKLAITIPSTVSRYTLRCAEEGDLYAQNIYESNGDYAKLASALDNGGKDNISVILIEIAEEDR